MRARGTTTLFAAALAALVSVTLAPGAPASGQEPGPRVSGTLQTVVRDDFTHRSDTTTTYLVLPDGGRLRLADAVGLPASGTLTGRLPAGFAVRDAVGSDRPVRLLDRRVTPTTTAQRAPRAHHAYVAVIDNKGPLPSESELRRLVGDTLDYWVEQSDGVISSFDLAGATYFTSSAVNDPDTGSCGLNGGAGAVWSEAGEKFPGVDFNTAPNHLIVLVPDACYTGGAIGLASVGSSLASGGSVLSDVDFYGARTTLVHELGHNLSLTHANAEVCPAGACTTEQYADAYDVMSYALDGTPAALNSVHRADLGLLGAAESPEVRLPADEDTSSQQFTLAARGLSAGRRSLTVIDPDDLTTYQVDYRAPTGRDVGAYWTTPGAAIGAGGGAISFATGVVVTADAPAKSSVLHPTKTGDNSWDAGRAEGQDWVSDSGAVRVHVDDLSADSATVTVTLHSDLPGLSPQSEPVLAGPAEVGARIQLDVGTWPLEASYATDWLIDGNAPLVPVFDDFEIFPEPYMRGATIQGVVTITAPDHRPEKRYTNVVGPITWPVFVSIQLLGSDPQVGVPVEIGVSTVPEGGVPTAYQWLRNGVDLPGATGASYTPVAGDVGSLLSVRVSTTGIEGRDPSSGLSASWGPVLPEPFRPGTPSLSGAPRVGVAVSALTGDWSAGTTFGYQWLRGGVPVAGATAASYTPSAADSGASLQVAVTGARGADSATRTSSGAAVQRGALTGPAPALVGRARVGKRLSVVTGSWPPGTTFGYEWLVDGRVVKTGPASLQLRRRYAAKAVSVRVTASLPGYDDTVVASAERKVKRRKSGR